MTRATPLIGLNTAVGHGSPAAVTRANWRRRGRARLAPITRPPAGVGAAAPLHTPSRTTLIPRRVFKASAGRVKLIHIDPPYKTGYDRVYPDDFSDPLAV